jgi:hypothetical protein
VQHARWVEDGYQKKTPVLANSSVACLRDFVVRTITLTTPRANRSHYYEVFVPNHL